MSCAVAGQPLTPLAPAVSDRIAEQPLRRLVSELRRAKPGDAILGVAGGEWHAGRPSDLLDHDLAAAAAAGGLLDLDGDLRWRLLVKLVSAGGLVTVLPAPSTPDAMRVYLRPDSLWLMRLLWDRCPGGDAAADLGTGSGFLAAALSSRFQRVVATDIEPVCLRYAAATLAMNRAPGRSTEVVAADAGAGLRTGAFDLVAANTPWMPIRIGAVDPDEPPHVWAYGGERGSEIPLRFIDDAVRLLAPGGTAIVLCLATVWADGAAPLSERVEALRAAGLTVEVVASEGLVSVEGMEWLCATVDGLVSARHVAVVITRG